MPLMAIASSQHTKLLKAEGVKIAILGADLFQDPLGSGVIPDLGVLEVSLKVGTLGADGVLDVTVVGDDVSVVPVKDLDLGREAGVFLH